MRHRRPCTAPCESLSYTTNFHQGPISRGCSMVSSEYHIERGRCGDADPTCTGTVRTRPARAIGAIWRAPQRHAAEHAELVTLRQSRATCAACSARKAETQMHADKKECTRMARSHGHRAWTSQNVSSAAICVNPFLSARIRVSTSCCVIKGEPAQSHHRDPRTKHARPRAGMRSETLIEGPANPDHAATLFPTDDRVRALVWSRQRPRWDRHGRHRRG
jgi:hypothetical protein